MRFISNGTWFEKGTEAKLIDDYRDHGWNAGLFSGIRITEDSDVEGGYPVGVRREDEEICSFDEFDIIED